MGNKNYNKSDMLPEIIVYCIDLVVSQILSDYENYRSHKKRKRKDLIFF